MTNEHSIVAAMQIASHPPKELDKYRSKDHIPFALYCFIKIWWYFKSNQNMPNSYSIIKGEKI